MRTTSDAVEILKQRTGIDPQRDPAMLQVADELRVGQLIYDARTAANLSQKQLADLIGATESEIAELEDAEFQGHSLAMLRRIALALHRKLEIRFVPDAQTA